MKVPFKNFAEQCEFLESFGLLTKQDISELIESGVLKYENSVTPEDKGTPPKHV